MWHVTHFLLLHSISIRFGIGATICTRWEIQCLPYAAIFQENPKAFPLFVRLWGKKKEDVPSSFPRAIVTVVNSDFRFGNPKSDCTPQLPFSYFPPLYITFKSSYRCRCGLVNGISTSPHWPKLPYSKRVAPLRQRSLEYTNASPRFKSGDAS